MRAICALRRTERSAEESAMSSRSRSAAAIIARSIVTVMKPGGGRKSGSILPPPPGHCGLKGIPSARINSRLLPRIVRSGRGRFQTVFARRIGSHDHGLDTDLPNRARRYEQFFLQVIVQT